MKLFRYAASRGLAPLVWSALFAGAAGLAATGTLTLTAGQLGHATAGRLQIVGYVLLAILAAVFRYASAAVSLRYTQRELADLSYGLSRLIVRAELRRAEELGGGRFLATLTDDLSAISHGVIGLPVLVTHVVLALGCFAYLAVVSPRILLIVMATVLLSVGGHLLVSRPALEKLAAARRERTELIAHCGALTDGITDLKLNRPRREAFLTTIMQPSLDRIARLNVEGQALFNIGSGYRQAIVVLSMAPIIFGASFLNYDGTLAAGAILTLFYLRGPVEGIMTGLPAVARAEVALRSYEAVIAALPVEDQESGASKRTFPRASTIQLSRVCYAYPGTDGFSIGPIDLTIQPGEILFITGGNGSGKTTLAKIIAGLYAPTSGVLSIDGEPITATNRDAYRQMISCVFAKYHLFGRLLGTDHREVGSLADEWLGRLRLDESVSIEDGRFSTLDLSTGQRKRLALLVAMVDDRPICVFDEWAAEQDPGYREEFYTRLLPDLRARGKAVIVITHDDRYFAIGDRLIRMEEGRIAPNERSRLAGRADAAVEPAAFGRSI